MTPEPAEIDAHANAIRARLLELHDRLKVDFPVYVLFTKADLVAGFIEYFGDLGETGRKQVWGATFQTADKTRNMVGEVPVEFDALLERLSEELTRPAAGRAGARARACCCSAFRRRWRALKRPIFDFLNQIFEPTRYHANATLRGFYFTSGTQEGTPIDQLIGALARSFGAEEVAGAPIRGTARASSSRPDPARSSSAKPPGSRPTGRGAPRDDPQGSGLRDDRLVRGRRIDGLATELQAQQHFDRGDSNTLMEPRTGTTRFHGGLNRVATISELSSFCSTVRRQLIMAPRLLLRAPFWAPPPSTHRGFCRHGLARMPGSTTDAAQTGFNAASARS